MDGCTDSDGGDEDNQARSERRAKVVVDWLVKEGGLDKSRSTATGSGDSTPVASNDDADVQKRNRRFVISAER